MPEPESNASARHADADGVEPRSVSRSEHLLSWVLAGFVLLALSWGYVNIDEAVRDSRGVAKAALERPIERAEAAHLQRMRALGLTGRFSENATFDAQQLIYERSDRRTTARERYRTALDAGEPAAALKTAYLRADRFVVLASRDLRELRSDRRAALRELRQYDDAQAGSIKALRDRVEAYEGASDRWIFLWRALLAFGTLALGLVLLRRLTERAARFVPLVHAVIGASTLLALALIVDYSEVNLDFYSVGPLGLSALGAALTIATFLALQRYLRKQRPVRRVRAGECGGCGYPVRAAALAGPGARIFCEGCGQPTVEPCGACGAPRRTGTEHCAACGAGAGAHAVA